MQEKERETNDVADLHRKESSSEETTSAKDSMSGNTRSITLSSGEDASENEANQIAAKVMQGEDVNLNRQVSDTAGAGNTFLPKGFTNLLQQTGGSGKPLPASVRDEMESGLGTDLGNVQLHSGNHSAQLNGLLGSNAFTLGNEVFFGGNNFNPESSRDKKLLTHELVHTQQPGNNVVRMNNDEELKQLREHDADSKAGGEAAREKEIKQAELDKFINEEGGAQSDRAIKAEFRRQRGIVMENEALAALDEQLKAIRYRYIRKLRDAGVQPAGLGDPFTEVNVPGVNRKKYLDKLTDLFKLYDQHIDRYNNFNAQIRADKMSLLSKNADMQKMQQDEKLSLKGVHADKTKDTLSPEEHAKEVLKWADAEARTSAYDFTLLVREKEKEDRDKKKDEGKGEFDSFVTAQKIIRDDLGGDLAHLTANDIQLVLKYFLKGTLSDDDKFTLVAFLSKHINDSNLESVFGYNKGSGGTLIDPADLIKVLESYDLLNYERRPYYEKKANGANLFIEMEKVRSTLVQRLKDMKAAKEANDERAKKGTLTAENTVHTGLQERYKFKGVGGLHAEFSWQSAQRSSGMFAPAVMIPDALHIAANKLQNAINEYSNASPTPPISQLQDDAWEFYNSIHNGAPPISEADFMSRYDAVNEIQFLLNESVPATDLVGGKYRTTGESYADLGQEIIAVSIQTGVSYLKLKERVDFFRKTDPAGFWLSAGTLGVAGAIFAIADGLTHDAASPGQMLLPLGNLGLSGSHTLIDRKIPTYNTSVNNKLSFDWSTKRDDAPPGLSMFNTLYNPGNTHPFFKGNNSVPGVFGNAGVTGSSALTVDNKEKEKFTYNASMTVHYAPGSEGTQMSDETLLGRLGMFMQQPTNPQQAGTLMNNSPEKDMVNLWGKTGFTYKRDWFTMNGSMAGGGYNLSGPQNERMGAFDYKFGVGADKIKLGSTTFSGSAGISGSYADSPTTQATNSATLSLKTGFEWKSFKFTFSFDDDLTKPAVYNKYKAELEYNGLGRYSPWVFKAALMNMYNSGLNEMAVTGGFVVGYNFGSGGKNYRIQKIQ